MIRIGIVDDHYILTEGIVKMLEYNDAFTVVFQATSGKECLEFLEETEYTIDVLLLDIGMPELSGYEVLSAIKEKYFHIKTIFLTSLDDYTHFSHAMSLGADGYLLKNTEFDELSLAIKDVFNGLVYIDKTLSSFMKRYIVNSDNKTILTKREKEIMVCVASGMMNKEIAVDLKIREETVKNHLTRIYYKFHVSDRTQAVLYAVRNHFIEL